ncbi:MAG TPA: hypothetical protein ENJ00_00540 [Phycisphaerales bacterium]|nr:hypothetical protein [Phycisphaerales bacterium]
MKHIATLLVIGLPMASQGQEVSLTRIASPDTQIRVLGNRPALHNGTVAFEGYLGPLYAQGEVIATASADGLGGYQILVSVGDPRPDRPGSVFSAFGNPGIYNGKVLFYGRETAGFASTYMSDNGAPYELYSDGGIFDPFIGPSGVTSPSSPAGVSFRDNAGNDQLLGQRNDPFVCASGVFGLTSVAGFRIAPMSDHHIIWPTKVTSVEFDRAIVAYDISTDSLYCIVTQADTIPNFGGPFDFFYKSDTDGVLAAFIGYDQNIGFNQHEGVYIRDISGTGPITMIADKLTTSPSGGNFGNFVNVSIDGDLIIFEGCSGGNFGCDRYGIYGCFLDNGVPGKIFNIITSDDMIDGRPVIDLTINPRGQDGNQLAFDIRHDAQNASLYVATITPPNQAGCIPDTNGDGMLSPADFTAWIYAFNNALPECDQNGDGSCTPPDFTAWISNFNDGC